MILSLSNNMCVHMYTCVYSPYTNDLHAENQNILPLSEIPVGEIFSLAKVWTCRISFSSKTAQPSNLSSISFSSRFHVSLL